MKFNNHHEERPHIGAFIHSNYKFESRRANNKSRDVMYLMFYRPSVQTLNILCANNVSDTVTDDPKWICWCNVCETFVHKEEMEHMSSSFTILSHTLSEETIAAHAFPQLIGSLTTEDDRCVEQLFECSYVC